MSVLTVEQCDTLKTLCLNRPNRANALNAEIVDALAREIDNACRDGTRHPWFYAASGKSFCSGFDLNEIESLPDADVRNAGSRYRTHVASSLTTHPW